MRRDGGAGKRQSALGLVVARVKLLKQGMDQKIPAKWHVLVLGAMTVFGLALLYLWSRNYALHDAVHDFDDRAYLYLNGLIEHKGFLQTAVAFANSRIYAFLTFFMLAGILVSFFLLSDRYDLGRRVALGLVIAFFSFFVTELRRRLDLFEMKRESPSLALDTSTDLEKIYPEWWDIKIISHNSFPSDHATAFLLITVLLWRFAGWRWGVGMLALMPFILLPRLMVGAHWLSDMVVGSLFYVSLAAGWLLCTPFVAWLCDKLAPKLLPVIARLRGRGFALPL